MENKKIIMYVLLAIGIFLLVAPSQYQALVPIPTGGYTKQIIAIVALVAAYYYYNGEKLF
jgi:uncharacterized membrane protein